MKSLLLSAAILLAPLWGGAAEERTCAIVIEKVQNNPESYTLVLKHDASCEILMDHNRSHIALVSKPYRPLAETPVGTTAVPSPAGQNRVGRIITLAKSKLGARYHPAQAGPDHFDCSGFVYYVFRQNGIRIPRSSLQQSTVGRKLKRRELKKGDMVFFDTHHRGHVNHSGIYLGDGRFIHSSSGHAYGVIISDLDKGFYREKFLWGVRKIPVKEAQ